MTDFLIDCYFNGFCKGRKNFVPTPCYAKKVLKCGVKKKFYLRLRALPLNVKFKSKIFLSTPPYAAQRGVDSALFGIARSRFSSSNLIEYLREFESICKTGLAMQAQGPQGYSLTKKTEGRKSRETVPLSSLAETMQHFRVRALLPPQSPEGRQEL
jgi:hypothetical protein